MARLLSVNVGVPRDVSWRGERVFTGVWKEPVQGRCMVRRLNVDGDGQGDLSGHGGEHRAVLVYQMDSYRYWEQTVYHGHARFESPNEVQVGEELLAASQIFINVGGRSAGRSLRLLLRCLLSYRLLHDHFT